RVVDELLAGLLDVLLAELDEVLPRAADGRRDLLARVRQAGSLEEVPAVAHGLRADVRAEADDRVVVSHLRPLPVKVGVLVLVGAEVLEVDELVSLLAE